MTLQGSVWWWGTGDERDYRASLHKALEVSHRGTAEPWQELELVRGVCCLHHSWEALAKGGLDATGQGQRLAHPQTRGHGIWL